MEVATLQGTILTPAAATDADARLIARWAYIADTGDYDSDGPFTPADYDRLAAIYANDARELAVVLDCRGLDYPVCATCGNERVVTREVVTGGWHWADGPQVDYVETPCPDCQDEAADWEPLVYADDALDAYLDGLYAQTRRDERAEVAA